MPVKFCANLTFQFQKETSDILTRYTLAKNAGFKAVELAWPYEFDKEIIADVKNQSGLQQVQVNAFAGAWYNFLP